MKAIRGKQLKTVIDRMNDAERYALLATLRTGERITEYQKQLRWYFLRMIVARAYALSYKKLYNVKRDWYHQTNAPLGELECDRILELIEHIRSYKVPKNLKPRHGLTVDQSVVALALRGYYFRYIQIDVSIHFRNKGVSFDEYKFSNNLSYGVAHREYTRYSRILELDKYLRAAKWDVYAALKLWVQDKNDAYDEYMDSPRSRLDRNHKRPTPAMVLGMYARLLRHVSVYSFTQNLSIDSMLEDHEEQGTVEPFYNSKPALTLLRDVSVYYKELTKEVSAIARGDRHDEFY